MPRYLLGIASAFLAPIQDAWANILDSYLSNKIFERITTLVLFSSAFNVIVLPLVWLFSRPHFLPVKLIMTVTGISLIEVIYQFPYYRSFRKTDTSIVTSLFSFGKIFVPFLAFFLVKERLSILQYVAYFGITLCATLLAFDAKKFRLNQAAWLMLGVSVILDVQTVLYKYAFEQGADWTTVLTWSSLIQFFFAGVLAFGTSNARRDVVLTTKQIKHVGLPVIFMQMLTWGGEAAESYALTIVPASVVSGVDSAQPIFVLAFALLFVRRNPELFHERLESQNLIKKMILFVLMGAGTIVVTFGHSD
ncbi:MAG TPA: hypothetical protein VG938_07980 [Verrucomicrobiae bacterium]|jgi:drug/metabolite transporter (DMT)-like permease|nr:hypothetical protein [Verrucomicrobiae bacterium]